MRLAMEQGSTKYSTRFYDQLFDVNLIIISTNLLVENYGQEKGLYKSNSWCLEKTYWSDG